MEINKENHIKISNGGELIVKFNNKLAFTHKPQYMVKQPVKSSKIDLIGDSLNEIKLKYKMHMMQKSKFTAFASPHMTSL